MEGSFDIGSVGDVGESAGPSDGRPPNPLAGAYRQCSDGKPRRATLVRHESLTETTLLDMANVVENNDQGCANDFLPIVRSGAWADIGFRQTMEDAYVRCDNFTQDYGIKHFGEGTSGFYGIFDGHGGKHAADFACANLPKFLLEDKDFLGDIERAVASAFLQTDAAFAEACSVNSALASGTTALAALVVGRSVLIDFLGDIERAVASAFLQTDAAFAEACSVNSALASGTTALAALVVGRLLVVANAGDCRAVLCRRGKAIAMSHDHKPACSKEKQRIESLGGYVDDGYLNGQLNVARAIGDWHMDGMKDRGGLGPLSAEPELIRTRLTEEDEFLILGCDGIWDVFQNQNAVDFARRKLQEHNDPATCSKELVDEALKRKSGDNLSVVFVCFQSKPPPVLTVPRPRVQRSISAEGLRELRNFLDSLAD